MNVRERTQRLRRAVVTVAVASLVVPVLTALPAHAGNSSGKMVTNDGRVLDVPARANLGAPAVSPSYQGKYPAPAGDPGVAPAALPRLLVTPATSFPARATAQLFIRSGSARGTCTGWLIGPRTVATAGHCVFFDFDGNGSVEWADQIVAIPGMDRTSQPFGSCSSSIFATSNEWHDLGDVRFDYAVAILDCAVGNTTGWYGFFESSWPNLQGETVDLNGYGVVPGAAADSQWTTFAGVSDNAVDPRLIEYDMFVLPGDSGAPVYTRSGFCPFCAAGIFTLGPGALGPLPVGPRISSQAFDFLAFWSFV